MLEALFGKAIASAIGSATAWTVAKFRRPSIRYERAPRNIFDHIKQGTSRERVRQLLGAPHAEIEHVWQYRFEDLLVEVAFTKQHGAKAVNVGLVGAKRRHRFPIPGCSKPLGLLTLADVMEDDHTVTYRASLRHEEILVQIVYGPAAIRQSWVFGALSCAYSRVLMDSTFEWDRENGRLVSAPSTVLINWVANVSNVDEAGIDWAID